MQKLKELYITKDEIKDDLDNLQNILEETSSIYTYVITNEQDKIFKDLLSDREDARKFINQYLKLKVPLEKDRLELYNSSFITSAYKSKEADVVYKIKNQKIFFLIEHQSTIDLSMPYRIENYSMEIINTAVDKEKMKRNDYLYPKVIPIVLYTGDKEWKAKLSFSDVQEKLQGYEEEDKSYTIVDVNNYSQKELLEDELFITKAMALEKSKTTVELIRDAREVLNKTPKDKFNKMIKIINIMLSKKEGKEKAKEMLEKIIKEKGEEDMLDVIERIERNERIALKKSEMKGIKKGKKEGIIEGIKEGIKETAKKMKAEGFDYDMIYKITGLRKNDL